MVKLCCACQKEKAALKRPKTSEQVLPVTMLPFRFSTKLVRASVIPVRSSNYPGLSLLLSESKMSCKTCLVLHLPKDKPCRRSDAVLQLCKECFYSALEEEVHQTIVQHNLFSPGERVAVAASGASQYLEKDIQTCLQHPSMYVVLI